MYALTGKTTRRSDSRGEAFVAEGPALHWQAMLAAAAWDRTERRRAEPGSQAR